jgi:hypothetical protein
MQQADLQDMFKKATVVSPDLLCPTPSHTWATKTPENTEGDPGDHGPENEDDIQMEYPCE